MGRGGWCLLDGGGLHERVPLLDEVSEQLPRLPHGGGGDLCRPGEPGEGHLVVEGVQHAVQNVQRQAQPHQVWERRLEHLRAHMEHTRLSSS